MNQQTKDFVEFFHIKEDDDELEKRMRLSLEALAANNLIGTALEGIKLTLKVLMLLLSNQQKTSCRKNTPRYVC